MPSLRRRRRGPQLADIEGAPIDRALHVAPWQRALAQQDPDSLIRGHVAIFGMGADLRSWHSPQRAVPRALARPLRCINRKASTTPNSTSSASASMGRPPVRARHPRPELRLCAYGCAAARRICATIMSCSAATYQWTLRRPRRDQVGSGRLEEACLLRRAAHRHAGRGRRC
jgi:hypothetical protein